MFKRLAIVLSLAPFAACGGKAASTADTTATPATPASVVELGEIVVFEDANAVLKIHASGATEIGGMSTGAVTYQPGPTVHTDGTFASPDGKLNFKLNADGTVTDLTSNKPLPLTVTADSATLTLGDQAAKLTLAADGTLAASFSSEAKIKVQGADTAGKRKLTLALFGVIILPTPAPAQPAPTPATPPAKK